MFVLPIRLHANWLCVFLCDFMLDVPIVIIVFNRPDKTLQVINSLATVQPSRLYVIADGPRSSHPNDEVLCKKTRELFESIPWPCSIFLEYSDVNLGLRKRITTGLDWVFSNEESAIILEDDVIATKSFFLFCEELLELYADVSNVFAISGNCFQPNQEQYDESYYFSRYAHCWGWATWRRSWVLNDDTMSSWPHERFKRPFRQMFEHSYIEFFWYRRFNSVYKGNIKAWSYAWLYSIWRRDGVSIIPSRNLVQNIGFDASATNTFSATNSKLLQPSLNLEFPLNHPKTTSVNKTADLYVEKHIFEIKPVLFTFVDRIKRKFFN